MFGLTQSSAAQTPTSITGGRIAGGGFGNSNGVNFAQPGGGSRTNSNYLDSQESYFVVRRHTLLPPKAITR